MDTVCPIDVKCASQIAALLRPPSPLQVQEYYERLIAEGDGGSGLQVKQNGDLGKGVYANLDFEEGELVLKDQMLVGSQHPSNKIDCLVCSFCFCFIGSIELQIGRKLYLKNLGVSTSDGCDKAMHIPKYHCTANEIDNSFVNGDRNLDECASSSSGNNVSLPNEVVESLLNGEMILPYSNKFPLAPTVACPGGCAEAYYCSKSCAEADWESSHSLLCTGQRSESLCRKALLKFVQHATETNDIFFLAAKTIAFILSRYRKLKAAHLKEQANYPSTAVLPLLLEAWKPISVGYKRRWWDCVSLPEDVDYSDETAFRMEIRDLAFRSLQLLKDALFDEECEPLFSLEIYGNIIGMFELNNLDLVVASPVEDYFLYIDDQPYPEKRKAEKITQPLVDALGDDYSVCCQGTAFYPLQSCMNHSCCPNSKAFKRDEDRDGQATIIAVRPICKGEEITISYIDDELPLEERRALLADYGFKCKCAKCLAEDP